MTSYREEAAHEAVRTPHVVPIKNKHKRERPERRAGCVQVTSGPMLSTTPSRGIFPVLYLDFPSELFSVNMYLLHS